MFASVVFPTWEAQKIMDGIRPESIIRRKTAPFPAGDPGQYIHQYARPYPLCKIVLIENEAFDAIQDKNIP